LRPDGKFSGFEDRATFQTWLVKGILELKEAAFKHDGKKIQMLLKELVPEYRPRSKER